MSEFGAWSEILPDVSLAGIAESDREARAEQQRADDERADRAAAAENRALARQAAGHVRQTPGEFIASRQGELADRIPKTLRDPLDAEVCVAPVRRSRASGDPDGVIGRALLAREARRVAAPAAAAAEALETVRERLRRPQADEYAGAWSAFRGTW